MHVFNVFFFAIFGCGAHFDLLNSRSLPYGNLKFGYTPSRRRIAILLHAVH